tara:strand:- start:5977 stop:6540 length:564 start_codon:yes stop_codon:yes gene_type:complete
MSNLIQVYNNTLTDDFCKLIINTFENDIVNQFQGETLGGLKISLKKTTDLYITNNSLTWKNIYKSLIPIINNYLNIYKNNNLKNLLNFTEFEFFPKFLMHKYCKNEDYFNFHHDFSKLGNFDYRYFTLLFYLNTVDDGGETEFIDGTKIKPEKGKLLIFPCLWTYVHKGCVPISDIKYVIACWIKIK